VQSEIIVDPSERITTVRYVTDNYDAFPPANMAWMDGRVVERSRDREAVAQALLLHPFVSGRLSLAHGCGVDVASVLRDVFLPRKVILEGVDFKPTRIPSGTRVARLCDGSYRSAAASRAQTCDVTLRLSESAYTTAIGPKNVVVSSNFGLFAPDRGQLLSLIPCIAAAVLHAEDLGIGRLILPVHDLTDAETGLLERLSALLAAVNVAIEAPFLGKDFDTLANDLPDRSALEMFLSERHEHCGSPEDLPDLWMGILLLARRTGDARGASAACARLQALAHKGHRFTAQERSLISPPVNQSPQLITSTPM
jgi:hypothetical protein